ncbi:MAG: membrane protein insertion efficiency factor YidD [Janthinobacterium lividum]
MIARLLVGLVKGYRLLLSPWLGQSCRFEPTCSAYAIEALQTHGAAVGSCLTVCRIARCQPWCDGGHDPVPPAGAKHRFFSFVISSAIPSDKKSSS